MTTHSMRIRISRFPSFSHISDKIEDKFESILEDGCRDSISRKFSDDDFDDFENNLFDMVIRTRNFEINYHTFHPNGPKS